MNDPSHLTTPSDDELPPMTHREQSWHAHQASLNAARSPVDPARDSIELAASALPGETVSGIFFPPTTAGSLMAIRLAGKLADDAGTPIQGEEESAVLIYCLACGEEAFALAESGQLPKLLKQARALIAPVPLRELKSLTAWCVATINSDADGAEKKPGPPQGPAVDPTQAETPRPPL